VDVLDAEAFGGAHDGAGVVGVVEVFEGDGQVAGAGVEDLDHSVYAAGEHD